MKKAPLLHLYPTLEAASRALAGFAGGKLAAALARHPRAAVALPGGSTPEGFLKALARLDLPWKSITLLPTDDRFVPSDHPRSNDRMMRACLAPALEAGATWFSLAPDEPTESVEAFAARRSPEIRQLLPLTLVVSGMGDDGHVASLFPGDSRIAHPEFVWPPLAPAYPAGLEPRVTLSPSALTGADELAVLFAGERKRSVFSDALARRDKPVALLFDRSRPLQAFIAEK